MSILRSDAVVLQSWKFRETSKIVTLYTRDYGKVKVIVKGARGPKSKFKGCLETLTHIHAIYYEKKTRDLQLLSHADLIDPHVQMIGQFERTTLGLAAAEIINKAVVGHEPAPQVFDLLVSVLQHFCRSKGFLESGFWYFESHFIILMGYKPTWESCLSCRSSLGNRGGFFQPESGGLLCYQCGNLKGGLVVSHETLEILFWLQRGSLDEVDQLKPEKSQIAEIRKMFDLYFRTHINEMKGLKALNMFYKYH